MKSGLLLLFALLAASNGPAYGHHFLIAAYSVGKTVTVEGKVVQFLFRKPHSYVQVQVANHGRPEQWLIEWGDASPLSRAGVFLDSLKPGDHVVVTGNPSRHPSEQKLRMVTVVRPSDGWRWSADDD